MTRTAGQQAEIRAAKSWKSHQESAGGDAPDFKPTTGHGFVMAGRVRIPVPKAELAAFCRRHHIRTLSFFGSVVRDDFQPESDVDVLVEFDAGRVPGFAFVGMEEELSQILGRKVDLNTTGFLGRLADRVRAEAVPLDAA